MKRAAIFVPFGLGGTVMLAFFLPLPDHKLATLRPEIAPFPSTSTNVTLTLNTASRLLLICRGNYSVTAMANRQQTNLYYNDLFSTRYFATPAHPHTFRVAIPTNVSKFKVSVSCYVASTARAKLIDALTDANGHIQENRLTGLLGELMCLLEPQSPAQDIESSTWIKNGDTWIEAP